MRFTRWLAGAALTALALAHGLPADPAPGPGAEAVTEEEEEYEWADGAGGGGRSARGGGGGGRALEIRKRIQRRFGGGGAGGPGGPEGGPGEGPDGKEGRGHKILEMLREADPALANEVEALKAKDPQRFQRQVMKALAPALRGFHQEAGPILRAEGQAGMQKVKEIGLLEVKSVVRALQMQDGTLDKKKGEPELKGILDQLFDKKLALQEDKLKYLETQIKELKDTIGSRKGHKKEIVDQRMSELSGTKQSYGW